jgi:hypothetical protein
MSIISIWNHYIFEVIARYQSFLTRPIFIGYPEHKKSFKVKKRNPAYGIPLYFLNEEY